MPYLPRFIPGALIAVIACGNGDTAGSAGTGATTTGAGSTSGSTADTTSEAPTTTGGEQPIECANSPHFAADKQPAAFVHVSPDGMDGPGCGAEDAPCATIGAALGATTPGTAIRIHTGTYAAEQISDVAGTAAAPIWIGGAPGEDRPKFVGSTPILHFSRLRHVVLHDLEIAQTLPSGQISALIVDDGEAYDDPEATRFVVVERVTLRDVDTLYSTAVRLAGVNDFWFIDCALEHILSQDGLEVIGSHRGVIAGNVMHDIGSSAITIGGGSADLEIRNNRLSDLGYQGVSLGKIDSPSTFRPPVAPGNDNLELQDIRVIGNLIVRPEVGVTFDGCVDCLVANNTIVFPKSALLSYFRGLGALEGVGFVATSDNRFTNNITYFRRSEVAGEEYLADFPALTSNSLQSNLWYAVDDPAASSPVGLPLVDEAAIAGVDPGFVDVDGDDYHLQEGSAAAGSGVSLAALSTDLDGECFGDPPARGAYR